MKTLYQPVGSKDIEAKIKPFKKLMIDFLLFAGSAEANIFYFFWDNVPDMPMTNAMYKIYLKIAQLTQLGETLENFAKFYHHMYFQNPCPITEFNELVLFELKDTLVKLSVGRGS